ncbi:zinc-binding protein [Poriferisphaera corsica]|uniref:Zinc-binding protein n=1 Tax=Poriferisphaera corsica TaxID=2528020 RepID=A0A517YU96_9BACT|nr:DNA gyrase inhibitor YacG [Poriferisphaera corsica]QDU33813.1 zinc-binding protein [Poriferisphaera corsica]
MNDQPAKPKSRKCSNPNCDHLTDESNPNYPFCSDRCRTVDLAKWRDELYMISRTIEEDDLEEDV